ISYQNSVLQTDANYFYKVDWNTTINIPVAPLSTLVTPWRMGKASEDQDLGGGGGVPGYSGDALRATNYSILRNEVNKVVAHDLKFNVFNAMSVDAIIAFLAHSGAINHRNMAREREGESIQSVE